jgi:hypothetical protein
MFGNFGVRLSAILDLSPAKVGQTLEKSANLCGRRERHLSRRTIEQTRPTRLHNKNWKHFGKHLPISASEKQKSQQPRLKHTTDNLKCSGLCQDITEFTPK